MSRPNAERDAPVAAPGATAKAALRLIDAGIRYLQRLRGRFAPSDVDDRQGGRHALSESKAAPVTEEPAPPSRLPFLRLALIALACLLVGSGVGALLSYRELSQQLGEHAGVVERMQEDLDAARKEEARNIKLLDKFQRENAEYRHEAREARRETENADRRVAELEAQIETMKRAEQAAQQARRAAANPPRAGQRPPPQKTGKCTASTTGELSECIEKFNR